MPERLHMSSHSVTIERLKESPQRLSSSITTFQLMSTLDTLIYRFLAPIIETSSLFDTFVPTTLYWSITNSRRKISGINNKKLIALLTFYMTRTTQEERLVVIAKMRLERNLLFSLGRIYLNLGKQYRKQYDLYTRKKAKDKDAQKNLKRLTELSAVFNGNSDKTYSAIHEVEFWYKQAQEFHSQIAERYYKLIVNSAVLLHKNNPERYDLEDIAQNFLVATYKAIDKCDHNKGTLTSYVQNWIKDARTSYGYQQYGISFLIPKSKKKQLATNNDGMTNNISVSLDDKSVLEISTEAVEVGIEKKQTVERVQRLSRIADPLGLARMKLGITEILTKEEVEVLKKGSYG